MINTKYTIYTENVCKQGIEKIISTYFGGYTIIEAKGYWKLESEKALKIEILGIKQDIYSIRRVCETIKRDNNQENVLLTIESIECELI